MTDPITFRIKSSSSQTEQVKQRQRMVERFLGKQNSQLFSTSFDLEKVGSKNCENLIGSVEIPVGVAGPVRVKSELLDGEVVLPLATTEPVQA